MKKNIQNLVFILVLAIFLVSPSLFWLSRGGNWTQSSILEDRELVTFPQISLREFKTGLKRIYQGLYSEAGEIFFNQFISGKFQRKVNKAAAEQMLLRIPLVELDKSFERTVIYSAYAALPDTALPSIFESDVSIDRSGEYLLQDLEFYDEAVKGEIDSRIANYEELLKDYPDVHFYVFNIETLPHSSSHPLTAYYPYADNGRSLAYFLENKPPELAFDNFALTSFEDYKAKFFKTDQHWNINASLDAYAQIYALIQQQYPDISPMLTAREIKKVDDVKFLGALARKTLYPVEPDILEYAEVDMPAYTTYVDGEQTTYGKRKGYLEGKFNHDKYYNHYRGFYGKAMVSIQYQFDNDSDRNLLMITSSYSRTIQMYLASHFHDTYVVDMRFDENSSKSIQQFVDEYGITDVLVFGQPSVTYYAAEDAIKP